MKMLKNLSMLLVMLIAGVCVSSCSKDDDDTVKSSMQDYYIEVDLKGGGYDAAELNKRKGVLNQTVSGFSEDFKGLTQDEAVYLFNEIMKEFKNGFSKQENDVDGTLEIVFYLKLVDNGNTIKKTTLLVTEKGCTIK